MNNVLLVDDDKDIINWLKNNFDWESFGCVVCGGANSAKEALEMLTSHDVNIMITDISMPNISGLELIRQVREIAPNIRVIIISGHSQFEYAKEGIRLGVENYLLKPLNVEELQEAIIKAQENLAFSTLFHEKDKKAFKQNVLRKLLQSSKHDYALKEQAQLCDIEINAKSYCVVRLISQNENSDLYLIENAVLTCISNGYPVIESSGVVSLILFSEHENNGFDSEIVALRQHDALCNFKILKGLAVNSAQGFYLSNRSASMCEKYAKAVKTNYVDAKELFSKEFFESGYYSLLFLIKNNFSGHDGENLEKNIELLFNGFCCDAKEKTPTFALYATALFVAYTLKDEGLNLNEESLHCLREILTCTEASEGMTRLKKMMSDITASDNDKSKLIHPYVYKSLKIMRANYVDDSLCLKSLAAKLGISTSYLGQLIKTSTGKHFNDLLMEIRLEAVLNLLESKSVSIGEIAETTGFSSQSYLTRVFKKYYNASPAEYRMNNAE